MLAHKRVYVCMCVCSVNRCAHLECAVRHKLLKETSPKYSSIYNNNNNNENNYYNNDEYACYHRLYTLNIGY